MALMTILLPRFGPLSMPICAGGAVEGRGFPSQLILLKLMDIRLATCGNSQGLMPGRGSAH